MSKLNSKSIYSDSTSSSDDEDNCLAFKRRKKTSELSASESKCVSNIIPESFHIRNGQENADYCRMPSHFPSNFQPHLFTAPPVDLSDPNVAKRQCKPVLLKDSLLNTSISSSASKIVNNPLEAISNSNVAPYRGKGYNRKYIDRDAVTDDYKDVLTPKEREINKRKFREEFERSQKNPKLTKDENNMSNLKIDDEVLKPKITYDHLKEDIEVKEYVNWIQPEVSIPEVLEFCTLLGWKKIGHKDSSTTNSNKQIFISQDIYDQLIETRKAISQVDYHSLLSARVRSNPYETLRTAFFMNRASLKVANLDALVDFGLTNPVNMSGERVVTDSELFFFADICAGPGGFSEYVLWKKGWMAKGFGFTLLESSCDFNLPSFLAGTPETFETHYGSKGTGDILDPENINSFTNHVLAATDGIGVHLVMADGGFEVENKELQEDTYQPLYLSQILLALNILREGGNFICKLFDLTSPFSVGLIYLLYNSFHCIGIHKPKACRPGNPERYIICRWRKGASFIQGIKKYLKECHEFLHATTLSSHPGTRDIVSIVPNEILTKAESCFFRYMKASNDLISTQQIVALQKLMIFSSDPKLEEIRQKECHDNALLYWRIPDIKRSSLKANAQEVASASELFANIIGDYKTDLFHTKIKELTPFELDDVFKAPYDWRVVVMAEGYSHYTRSFYLGVGGGEVYRFDNGVWRDMPQKVNLPDKTFVYGEFAYEKTSSSEKETITFNIIDGMILGGRDIRNIHYIQRHDFCSKLVKALTKPISGNYVPIRLKPLVRMEHLKEIFEKITTVSALKDNHKEVRYFPVEHTNESLFFKPCGLLFFKITKDPWTMAISRKEARKYWYNILTNESTFSCPETSVGDFKYTIENRYCWTWTKDTKVDMINCLIDDSNIDINTIYPKQLTDLVERYFNKVKSHKYSFK